MTIRNYKVWMKGSTIEEKKDLAARARTSLSTLYQLDYGVRANGKPFVASSELAIRVAKGIAAVNAKARPKGNLLPLPEVSQGDLSSVCAGCKFYKDCR